MSKEWVDIADTAVKIGLGALITGVFTYLGIKFSHKSERNKFMLEHKTKLLEQVADNVEEYFKSWSNYNDALGGATLLRKRYGKEDEKFTEKQKRFINNRDKELTESLAKRESAISKLRLMGANKASEALESTRFLAQDIRNRIVFMNEIPKFDEVSEYCEDVKDIKKEVHKALADFYATFQT